MFNYVFYNYFLIFNDIMFYDSWKIQMDFLIISLLDILYKTKNLIERESYITHILIQILSI